MYWWKLNSQRHILKINQQHLSEHDTAATPRSWSRQPSISLLCSTTKVQYQVVGISKLWDMGNFRSYQHPHYRSDNFGTVLLHALASIGRNPSKQAGGKHNTRIQQSRIAAPGLQETATAPCWFLLPISNVKRGFLFWFIKPFFTISSLFFFFG